MKNKLRKEIRKIIEELANDQTKTSLYSKSGERKPYSKELMKKAIEGGLEVGLLFKSDNEDYTMPTSKYRIIWPVAMGTSKKGNPVVRGYHIIGQSEGEAIKTGIRSAEAENAWRLFNTKNVKGMWLTGNVFDTLPPNYNPNDKSMTSVEVAFNQSKAKSTQSTQVKPEAEPEPTKMGSANVSKPESPEVEKEKPVSPQASNIANRPTMTVMGTKNNQDLNNPPTEVEP